MQLMTKNLRVNIPQNYMIDRIPLHTLAYPYNNVNFDLFSLKVLDHKIQFKVCVSFIVALNIFKK